MTESSYPTTAIASHAIPSFAPPESLASAQHQRYGGAAASIDGTLEDDGQISCICGYADDDGNTVACDSCDRWQHTICYWPQYEGQELPEELQHYCVDCQPRDFDANAAHARQRFRREQQDSLLNGARRQAPKSHKKKIKDPAGAAYTNGWPLDKARHDRNSASPRDQPPPAKRPKTSHRASDSTTNVSTKGHSRKRTASNVNYRHSLSQSPESPFDLYSDDFITCFKQDDWEVTQANLWNEIAVTNALSEWLRAPDEVFREKHGLEKTEVLMRWDGELDEIPGKADILIQPMHDPDIKDGDGDNVTWKTVTVKEPVASGAYIGELKGRVGFRDQYKVDPQNRWSQLRHPEPFVFFHPRLPLYIDARHEGTPLRYVRRSCHPNARLQVLVTDSTDYRFCFMATEQIDPGMEVAVGWDTADSLLHRSSNGNGVSTREIDELSAWVSTVLSNCGPCACQLSTTDCAMSRFDRRSVRSSYDEGMSSMKVPKAKRRKPGQHISPLNTHAANSRAGSEARRIDLDDEHTDSRSTSGSGRDSGSRDITPNTHYSTNGSLSAMPELSERERKKLAKEEEMFRRQEEEKSGKQAKKKRNSAGSNVLTPGPSSSKQFVLPVSSKYADAGTSKQSGLPSARTMTAKRPKVASGQKTPNKSIVKSVKRPRPTYVDAETQCDMDKEDAAKRAASPSPRKRRISTTQYLLQRCALNNAKLKAQKSGTGWPISPKQHTPMDIDQNPATKPKSPLSIQLHPPAARASENEPLAKPELSDDVQMTDAPTAPQPMRSSPVGNLSPDEVMKIHPAPFGASMTSHLAMEPTAPPWSAKTSLSLPDISASSPQHAHKSVGMYLQMPPPPSNPFAGPGPLLSAGSACSPGTITGSITQSPAGLTVSVPMFSPAVSAAVTPSPARKKLSLSDYTRRSKAKDKEPEPKTERESSPASVASGPAAPPLQSSSSEAQTAENGTALDDDVRTDDGGDVPISKA